MPDAMALGALSLSTTSGVQGRPFRAAIVGLTTGKVDVLNDGSPGFSTVNGRVSSDGLPYPVSTVVLREYEPGVGPGFLDTRIDITAATREQLRAQAQASVDPGRTVRRSRVAGTEQPDGSLVYKLIVEDDLGASRSYDPAGSTPAPIFTTAPSITGTPTVGQPLSALTFTDGVVSGGSITARSILLAGATVAASYVLQAADVGKSVVYRNASGAVVSDSQAVSVVNPVPTTATFSGAQVAPLATGTTDTRTAGQIKIAADLQVTGLMGGVFVLWVRGTDATMKLLGTDPNGVVEVSVDGGAYTKPPVVNGRYVVLAGAADTDHTIIMRAHSSTGVTQGTFTSGASANDIVQVTGINPTLVLLNHWAQVDDGTNLKSTGHVVMDNRQGAALSPSKVRFVTDQQTAPFREQIVALTVRGEYTSLVVASRFRYIAVSTDNGAPTYYDLGDNLPAVKVITGLSGVHTYAVATSGPDNARGVNMLAVSGTLGAGGRIAPARPRFDQYGDSITEGVFPSTSPAHTDVVRTAFGLGRVPSNYGLAGLTIPQVRDWITEVLSRKTVTSADMAVLASGRNNALGGVPPNDPGLTTDEVAAYTDSCNRLLAAGYGLVIARGVTPGPFATRNAQMKAAVEAINNPRLKWVETSGWTGISTGASEVDGLHPSDAGYAKMTADYELPAYRALGAQAA